VSDTLVRDVNNNCCGPLLRSIGDGRRLLFPLRGLGDLAVVK